MWSKKQFLAYVLLYAAKGNYIENEAERALILSKVGMKAYASVYQEFEADNDYQSIQKILKHIDYHHYEKSDINQLVLDIKEMLLIDGDVDVLENNLFLMLNKILVS